MAKPTLKHRIFIAEPMGEKSVTDLAGVGEVLGQRLGTAGFDKAYVVLGQFLVLKKDQRQFQQWMKEICNAKLSDSTRCYKCLRAWCDNFL